MAFWILIAGLAISGFLAWIALSQQARWAWLAGGLVFLLTVSYVALDYWIVTDEEQVTQLVYDLTARVAANDVEAAASLVAPADEATRQMIRQEMPNYRFRQLYVTGIEPVEFAAGDTPRKATVEFRVFFDVEAPQIPFSGRGLRVVELDLGKGDDDRWYVEGYDHWSPPELTRFGMPDVRRDDLVP